MSQIASPSLNKLHPFASMYALWAQRELLWQFTQRNVELRHKGSHLGLIWSILNPLLMLGLYVLVFGFIFGGTFNVLPNETKLDYALAIFLGLTIFQMLAETLNTAPGVIVGNPNFVKKVVFPLEILPAAAVGASLFHMLISLGMVLLGVALFGTGLTLAAIWLPVIIVPLMLFAIGLAWFFAALGVFLRDISQLVSFLSLALMYASAVFYPSSVVPPAIWTFLRFNPLLLAIELSRDAVMWHRPLDFLHLSYLYGAGLLTCVFGYWSFRKMAPSFADVL